MEAEVSSKIPVEACLWYFENVFGIRFLVFSQNWVDPRGRNYLSGNKALVPKKVLQRFGGVSIERGVCRKRRIYVKRVVTNKFVQIQITIAALVEGESSFETIERYRDLQNASLLLLFYNKCVSRQRKINNQHKAILPTHVSPKFI